MPAVVYNQESGTLTIDGITIDGNRWPQPCPKCSGSTFYYDSYDAAFCPDCNVWLEPACTDATCDYCADRPARPWPPRRVP